MPIALDQLPDDVDALKSLVADQLARNGQLQADKQAVVQRNEQLTTENQHYKAQVLTLTEQLNLALARRYAASSEKLSPDQIRLFDEAEVEIQAAASTEDETVTVPEHTRRKRGRKKLPAALPRVEVIHELPDSERVCPHDGNPLTEIGAVTSEQLDINTVLLVDANLRHPLMLEHLGLAPHQGLSDYLIDDTPIAELLIKPDRVEHLMILPGGRPLTNSSEALNSPKMAQLVKDMKSRCHSRIIIFDLPPVMSSSDALAFSPYVDATLLVIEEGGTQKHEIEHAIELLSSTNIIGTVLNKAERKSAWWAASDLL